MVLQSLSPKRKAAKAAPCVLVLWGEYFDEVAATIFIVTLRQAGLAVRVVGVHGLLAAGRNGLLLHADMVLGEIKPLINQATCLVLPCSRAALKRLETEPRIHELFAGVAHNGAKIVVHDHGVIQHSVLQSLFGMDGAIVVYASDDNLPIFAQELAQELIPAGERLATRCTHTFDISPASPAF